MRSRYRYDKITGELVEVSGEAVTLPRVHVISDGMDATRHPVTGRIYESKSRFRADTRATGCVELGNDCLRTPAPNIDRRERAGETLVQTMREMGLK